jgi:hypothetical protein
MRVSECELNGGFHDRALSGNRLQDFVITLKFKLLVG